MTTNELIDFIKLFEGYKENAYLDDNGIWTVGDGHTYIKNKKGNLIKVKEGDTLSEEQSAELITEKLKDIEASGRYYFSNWDRFPEDTKMALLDMGFNGGKNIFKSYPKFSKYLNDAYNDGYLNLEELNQIASEMSIKENNKSNYNDRIQRRLALIAGMYDHSKSKGNINTATSGTSDYQNFYSKIKDPNSFESYYFNKTHTNPYEKINYFAPKNKLINKEKAIYYNEGDHDVVGTQDLRTEPIWKILINPDTIHVPIGFGSLFINNIYK